MIRRALVVAAALALCAVTEVACGGGNAASNLARRPEYKPEGESKCRVKNSQSAPLVVEWPPAERGKLEASIRGGLVAVRYEGCDMELLPACHVRSSEYRYAPLTRKQSRVTIDDEDELYAELPAGAVRLEAKLKKAGQLNVEMTIVGRWEIARGGVRRAELEGDCDRATHVVTGLTVGAFTFFAGADAHVAGGVSGPLGAGGGASSGSKNELLSKDGDDAACATATNHDVAPPDGCGALVRIEVATLDTSTRDAVPPPVEPRALDTHDCASGTRWNGSECVDIRTRTRPKPYVPSPETTSTPPQSSTSSTSSTSASAPSSGDRGTLGSVVGWTSVAALSAWGIFGTIALSTAKNVTDPATASDIQCNKDRHYCTPAGLDTKDKAHTYALLSDGFLGLGVITGVVYYFLPQQPASAPRVGATPLPGGARVSVEGRF